MAPKYLKEAVEEFGLPLYVEWTYNSIPHANVMLGIEESFPNCYVAEDGQHYLDSYLIAYYEPLAPVMPSGPFALKRYNDECNCPDLLAGHHNGCKLWKP